MTAQLFQSTLILEIQLLELEVSEFHFKFMNKRVKN